MIGMDNSPPVARLKRVETNIRGRCSMTSPQSKHLHDELVLLLDMQLCTLEKEVFGVATESEILDYEYRQDRIGELYYQLLGREVIAA